jgi:hypothetical protein
MGLRIVPFVAKATIDRIETGVEISPANLLAQSTLVQSSLETIPSERKMCPR